MTFKMNAYNEYIAKSRYSRFLDKEGRREHWNETVAQSSLQFGNIMKLNLKL